MAKKSAQDWIDIYNSGLEYRKVFGLEQTWTDLEAKFFSVSSDCDTGPNILASKGDTIISALSVPEVGVMVMPRTAEASVSAPVVQSFDNGMLEGLDVADAMEQALTFAFLFGVGLVKIGYDSEFGYDAKLAVGGFGRTLSQFDSKGSLIESGKARSGMPWVRAVMPHDVVVPWGTRELADAPYIFHRVVRDVRDVHRDEKYLPVAKRLKGTISMKDVVLGYSSLKDNAEDGTGATSPDAEGEKNFIQLIEVMDKTEKKVIVIALGDDEPTVIREDENSLQVDNQLPWVDVCMTLRVRSFWVTPPAFYAAPHQNELDDIHYQAKVQRRASILKLLARKGAFSAESKAALLNSKPGMYVEVEDLGGSLDEVVKYVGANSNLNTLLHIEEESVEANARDTLGISRNLAGEYSAHARTSATETGVVQQGGEMRMGRKQKALRKSYRTLLRLLNGIVAANWTVSQSARVVGQDGSEKWEQVSAEILQSSLYTFSVSFSTEHFGSPLARQQSALQNYQMLMADPRVDKNALLQELIASLDTPGARMAKGPQQAGVGALAPAPGGGGESANL